MQAPKRLYIFTGKGGVGKSLISLAFARWLKERGHKTLHVSLSQQVLGDDVRASVTSAPGGGWAEQRHLELETSARDYITKKLGSAMIANWIVGSAYFRALVNMLPGFGYVISLGHILEMIHTDPQLTVVLDAPASGHALTMMEATQNFREIFQSGAVFEDTEKMLSKLYDRSHTAIRILTLPTELALAEAEELRASLQQLAEFDSKIVLNHSLQPWRQEIATAPDALLRKLALEDELLSKHATQISAKIPYCATTGRDALYNDLQPTLEGLL